MSNDRKTGLSLFLALAALVAIPLHAPGETPAPATQPTPVLYGTDLFHPHEDPDDHFDLATIFAIPGLDLRGVFLDQGGRQRSSPGQIPVSQLNALTGRHVPAAPGLATPLTSPTDPGLDQPEHFQGGVRLILDTLRTATTRVDLVAVGSMRDLTAAFNRDPTLFRQRAGRVLVFVGEASDPKFQEYNVSLDPKAFIGLLRSDLDIYWVPCFDGGLWQNKGHASFWKIRHAELLHNVPPPLLQYFIYALEKETAEPLAFLRQPVDPTRRQRLMDGTRNLWCTAIFASLRGDPAQPLHGQAFAFDPITVSIDDQAVVHEATPGSPGAHRLHRFRVLDPASYPAVMTRATAAILEEFPIHRP